MARHIDADALIEILNNKTKTDYEMGLYNHGALTQSFIRLVESQPTADAVEIVRCKDCSYRHTHICAITGAKTLFCDYWDKPYPIEGEHYCGYGTRTPQKEG